MVAPRIGEGKVCRLAGLSAEHMRELQRKLVILDVEVGLGEKPTPSLLSGGQNSEDRLKPLAVQLCLIVEIFECERELFSLGHSFD